MGVIVLVAAVSLVWLVHPWFEASNDAAMYVVCAKNLLAGEGYTFLDEPFRVRPPGFSVLLAPVVALRGIDFSALNLYVAAWGVLCVGLFFVWARTRVSTWVGAALAALVWFNPGFASLRNQVMSDVPGTALVFGCLLLERWCARQPSMRRDVVLGLALGLSAYVRSIVLVLVVGIVVARLLVGRKEGASLGRVLLLRILPLVALVALVQAPWKVRDVYHHPLPPVDQTSLYDYSSGMWNSDRGDPRSPRVPIEDVFARVPRHARATLGVLGGRMQSNELGVVNLTLGVLFVLALVVQGVRRRGAAELFACGAILLVLPYFSFQDRLLLPVLMIAWTAAAELLEELGTRRLGARGPLVALVPVCALLAIDFHPRANWEEVRLAHETCERWAARANELLPRDERVAVPMEGWRWTIWLDRPVWTLFFGWNRGGGGPGIAPVLARHKIDLVLVTPFTASDAAMRPWLTTRYAVLHDEPDLALVRVRPRNGR
ncbi:MAG: glycosyltransferase family 39 protein [Planctomycetes bacterium]|nr:glycosyltransferase family 39 protein [Planctomycetota bacterium]